MALTQFLKPDGLNRQAVSKAEPLPTTTGSGQGISSTVGEGNLVALTGATVASGSITLDANTESAVIDTQGYENVALTVSGFGVATIQLQWSNLSSSGFTAGLVTTVGTTTSSVNVAANGQYTAASGGRYLRIITTAYTSGTLVVTPTLSAGGGSGTSTGGGGGVSQGAVLTAAPTYTTGTNADLSLTTKGGLRTTLQDASGNVIDFTSPVPVSQSGTWTVQPGNTANTTAWLFTGSGSAATPATGVLSAQGFVADDAAAGTTNPLAVGGIYRLTLPTYTDLDRTQAHYTSRGETIVGGAVAAATTDLGNPIKVGGVYNSSPPTYTAGQRTEFQVGTRGALSVQLTGVDSATGISGLATNTDATAPAAGASSLRTASMELVLGASNLERVRSIGGAATGGVGTIAVHTAPTSLAPGAIAPSARTTAGSNQVVKASAGNLYSFNVATGGTAGWVLVFDATVLPADGAVTPLKAYAIAANASLEVRYDPPIRHAVGITVGFSSTGPFTLTASATAFISGEGV